MTVCRFWQKGYCREGDNCRFEHPQRSDNVQQNRNQSQARGQFRNNDQNRFATLGGHNVNYETGGPRNQSRGGGAAGGGSGRTNQQVPHDARRYELDPKRIAEDLGPERPEWIMSAYGPGKDPPAQLFGGFPLEQSPEEIRVLHYLNVVAGNPLQSAQQEQELATQANQHVQTALSDPTGAVRYILDGLKTRPNRKDQCGPRNTPGEFSKDLRKRVLQNSNKSQPNIARTGIQPSGSFGSQQTPVGFGGGAAGTSQIGNIVQVQPMSGNNTQSPPQMTQQQPVPTNSYQQAPFATQNTQQPGFGNVSSFGGGFNTNPSNIGPGNPMNTGTSVGNPALSSQTASSQGSGFGSPFTSRATGGGLGNGFGQNGQMNGVSSSDVQANGIAVPRSIGNGFGSAQTTRANGETVGNASILQTQSNQSASFSNMLPPAHTDSHLTRRDGGNRLISWKGKPVEYADGQPCYRMDSGSLQRIYFPDGQPAISNSNWPEDENEWGGAVSKRDTQEAYKLVRQTGAFKNGWMPERAPSPDMCRWDV